MNLVQTVAPAAFAVSLPEVQDHVRSTETAEDAYLTALIARAQSAVEERFGIALTEQTLRLTLRRFPCGNGGRIQLPRPPLVVVTDFKYVAADGTLTTLTSADYQLDSDARPACLYPPVGESWPETQDDVPNAVRITYTAGHGTPTEEAPDLIPMPVKVKQGMLLRIGDWYENRESGEENWTAIDALLGNLRPWADYDKQ